MDSQLQKDLFLAAILLSSLIGTDACELRGNLEKCEAIMKIAIQDSKKGRRGYDYGYDYDDNDYYDFSRAASPANYDDRSGCASTNLCKSYVQGGMSIEESCAKELKKKVNPQCSAHKQCKDLIGNCCPADDGTYLECCPNNKPIDR